MRGEVFTFTPGINLGKGSGFEERARRTPRKSKLGRACVDNGFKCEEIDARTYWKMKMGLESECEERALRTVHES